MILKQISSTGQPVIPYGSFVNNQASSFADTFTTNYG